MTIHSPRRFVPTHHMYEVLNNLQPVQDDVRAMTVIRASWIIAQVAVILKKTLGNNMPVVDNDFAVGCILLRGLEVINMKGHVNQSDIDFFYLSGVVPNDSIHTHTDKYSQARLDNGYAMREALRIQLKAMGLLTKQT